MIDTSKIQHILSAWKGHEDFAIDLIQKLQPKTIVDLGVDYGFSTFAMALPGIGKVYGIDWFQGDEYAGQRNTYKDVLDELAKQNLPNVEIIKGDFSVIADPWNKPIDILHIDGDHSFEAISQNFSDWAGLVKRNGVIMMHDTCSFKETVGKFFAQIPDWKYFKHNFEHSHGLGVVTESEATFQTIMSCKNFPQL